MMIRTAPVFALPVIEPEPEQPPTMSAANASAQKPSLPIPVVRMDVALP